MRRLLTIASAILALGSWAGAEGQIAGASLGVAAPTWSEAMAQSSDMRSFTGEDDAGIVSASWERVSDEELARRIETVKRKAREEGGAPEPVNVAWKIHVWSNGPEGSNYLGWIWCGADTNLYTLETLGTPVIYDARVVSKRSVLVVYGNQMESLCEARAPSADGGEMKYLRETNWLRSQLPNPDLPAIERAFLRGQGDRVVNFTHENNPVTVSAWWERVPDEELRKRAEESRKKLGPPRPGVTLGKLGYTWNLHFWTNSAAGSNHCCSISIMYDKDMYPLEQLGDPVIYDAMVVSNRSLLVVHGNGAETTCRDYLLSATNKVLRHSSQYFHVPGLPGGMIERAFLQSDSDTNVLVTFMDNAGMTNNAVWTKEAGWTLTNNASKWLFHNFRK